MLFNSYIFILLFLPVTVIGYYLCNHVEKKQTGQVGLAWLFVMSLWFYAYAEIRHLPLLLGITIFNYLIGKRLIRKKEKFVLGLGITGNLLLLFYYKYMNFFMENLYALGEKQWDALEILLPLGISFLTFGEISYLVDCYHRAQTEKDSFFEFALWTVFFPKISSGPIMLYGEFAEQLRKKENRILSYDNLSKGLYAFSMGLAKKVLLADNLGKLANPGFSSIGDLNTGTAVFVMLSYTLQLYFDFSGYCDMGIGIGKMLNLNLPLNFNSPYKAVSVSDFWTRWHMTLTRFFTRYLYIPLGGSKKGKLRTYGNTLLVFLLSGLWHGANWTFVIWGGLHGIFMTLEKIIAGGSKKNESEDREGKYFSLKKAVGTCYAFVFVNFAWVFFRIPKISDAALFFRRMLGGGIRLQQNITDRVNDMIEIRLLGRLGLNPVIDRFPWLLATVILSIILIGVLGTKNTTEKMEEEKYSLKRSMVTILLLIWSVISLSEVSEFLYFNF